MTIMLSSESRTLTMPNLLRYRFPNARWELVLPEAALDALATHAQHSVCAPEAAGQLYARTLTTQDVVIEHLTLLQPKLSARDKFRFDLAKANEERVMLFNQGLHCIGLWHTHPEVTPRPSPEDLAFAKNHAQAASCQLAGILFLIVGTASFPQGLLVGAHDTSRFWTAQPAR